MSDKKTAVEWLVDQLEKWELYSKISFQCLKEIEQAKAMEKEQIENAWNGGIECTEEGGKSFDQYYKETYEK
jgi:hypothetical protein